MEIQTKHFTALSINELYDLLQLRSAVFVVEQNCVYLDLDGLDKDAYHVIAYEGDKCLATTRILKPGVVYNEFAIGRVVSSPAMRNAKLGHKIMTSAKEYIATHFSDSPIRLSAQTHLVNFYAKHGFKTTGKNYLEDGIPHSEMLYTPNN